MIKQKQYSFTSENVTVYNGTYVVSIVHNIGHTNYIATVTNGDGEIVNTSNLFTVGANSLRIYAENQSITGLWTVNIYYDDTQSGYDFKRLFEQPQADNMYAASDYKLAFADSNGIIKNITLNDLKTVIQNGLTASDYLLRSNNLADLPNKATARQNLSVYSKAEIDSVLGDMYPASGYIASISDFRPASGLSAVPTVDIYKDFAGFSLTFRWIVGDNVTTAATGLNVGTFDVQPVSGSTLSFLTTYAPVYIYFGGSQGVAAHFGAGQIALVPTAISSGVRFTVYVWKQSIGAGSANVEVSSTLRASLISH